jgi:hypothetical protein
VFWVVLFLTVGTRLKSGSCVKKAVGTEWYLIIAVCVKILAAAFFFRIPLILDRMDCS